MNADRLNERLPYAADAERAVLGSCIVAQRCIAGVVERLSAEDFYLSENRVLFEGIYSMFNLNLQVDPVTLANYLKQKGLLEDAGGHSYLGQLLDVTPTPANVLDYAAIVRENSVLRRLASAASDIYSHAVSGKGQAELILDDAEQKIYEIRGGRSQGELTPIQSILTENYKKISDAYAAGGILPGAPSGFSELDTALSGLNPSDLIILAGRPATGKTSFALNIMQAVAEKTGKACAFFSLEMSKEQIVMRLMSTHSGIDMRRLREGSLHSDKEWDDLARASDLLADLPIYIDDTSSIGTGAIKSKCRRLGDKLGFVAIDYLQLMQSGRKNESNRAQEVGEMSRNLKIMAKELNVPILCLSQLSRASEKGARRPMLSDLRDSGSIEQDADAVLFLHREDPSPENPGAANQCECIIAKNRHGATGNIKLHWTGSIIRFTGVDKKHQEEE